MDSDVVIIQGSSRTNGDTKFFSDEIAKRFPADIIDLKNHQIGHYDYKHANAADDFLPLIKKLLTYKLWIIASPVYWYSVSGYIKVFLDRLSDLLQTEKSLGKELRGKAIATISVSNDNDVPTSFYQPLILSAEYLGMNYLGEIHLHDASAGVNKVSEERMKSFIDQLSKYDKI